MNLVADKLVCGPQLIQVITFRPSGIGPVPLWSIALITVLWNECSAVEDVGEARALPEARCGPYVGASGLIISATDQHWVITQLVERLLNCSSGYLEI